MWSKLLASCIVFIAAPSIYVNADDVCGECMKSNYVQCINETSYILCAEDTQVTTVAPVDEEVYNCPANQYCTNSRSVCDANPDGKNIKSVCSDEATQKACGSCAGKPNARLICVSSTQFAICKDEKSSNPLSCNAGQLCSEDLVTEHGLKKVCAPQAVLDFFEAKSCGEETVTPKPTTIPATPPVTPIVNPYNECREKSAGVNSPYFQIPYPNYCRSYIYCERNGNTYTSLIMNCRSGQFYSDERKACIPATSCPQQQRN